jgi:sulfur relay (sulfurtransferase) DsrF/TusC family protein
MPKVLNIVSVAYRATLEEQDDTIVWLTHALKGAGADIDVLLRGNAVCYAAKGQNAAGLSFGSKQQSNPPDLARDVGKLIEKGIQVFVVQDDAAQRGLEGSDLIDGIKPIAKSGLPKLLDAYPRVWHW